MPAETCKECGAALPSGTGCRANLDGLLFMEAAIPGGPGARAHFLAVATYALQHPVSMRYLGETYLGARQAVKAVIDGSMTISDVRRAAREYARGSRRVLRGEGDPVPQVRHRDWPLNVAHVLDGTPDDYRQRVDEWAKATLQALDSI